VVVCHQRIDLRRLPVIFRRVETDFPQPEIVAGKLEGNTTRFASPQGIATTKKIQCCSLLTGLAIYKPVQFKTLCAMLGGYEWARIEHFTLTILFTLFFVVHVLQVLKAGWNNFRGMIAGFEVRPSVKPASEQLMTDDTAPLTNTPQNI